MADQNSSRSNPTLFIGLIIGVFAALLMFVLATQLQGKGRVYVAKENIPAYSKLVPGENIVLENVPEDSITDNDLREADVKASRGSLVSRLELLQGSRVDRRAASASTTGTLGVVKRGKERVIALEASFKGAVAGLIGPGSVVDIYNGEPGEDDDGAIASDVKVLGVGQGSGVTRNLQDGESDVETKSNDATIFILVAVPIDQAGRLLALSTASLSLDPYQAFDKSGNICNIDDCANRATAADAQNAAETTPGAVGDPASPTNDPDSPTGEVGTPGDGSDTTGAGGSNDPSKSPDLGSGE